MGPDSLCRTCRMYPRHVEEFEGSREYSLCLSCMEAAKIILGCEEKVQFLTKEDEKEETYEDFDFFLYTKLMDARDSISASLAECYATIEGNRYNFMQAINLEAKMEITKTEIPILGKTGKGNKPTGWKGTGSATFHFNTSVFRNCYTGTRRRAKSFILIFRSRTKIRPLRSADRGNLKRLLYGWRDFGEV